jgi:hypothetical protein
VQLSDQEDTITWKWTKHGQYTAKSAYTAQLAGSFCPYMAIWGAKVEGKHKFFAWLMVQRKILTEDKLLSRNWPCLPICQLCDQELETAEHLCLHCVFAQEVWFLVTQWTDGLVSIPGGQISIQDWWNSALQGAPRKLKIERASTLIYTAWNLWKERNRRVFEGTRTTPSRILHLIKEEVAIRAIACGVQPEARDS